MILMNAYDAKPEAMNVAHLRCVTCGGHDAPLIVAWFTDLNPRRQTIPLAAHKGECDRKLEAAAGQSGSWEDAADVAGFLQRNTLDPPKVGVEEEGGRELLRLVDYPVDLEWTLQILRRIPSPLIRP